MKATNLCITLATLVLLSCGNKIKNDQTVGKPEMKAYNMLTNQLTEQLKKRFNGNIYESEKVKPVELKDEIRVGIPEGIGYLFKKDNSKYIKGDLNNDKKTDLIIWSDFEEKQGLKTRKYFVFLQKDEKNYEYKTEFKADDIVFDNCRNTVLKLGNFYLDSIQNGLLIGHSEYQGLVEENYLSFSYRCTTEKYSIDFSKNTLELTYQSDLEKKNYETQTYEKVQKNK